MVLGRPELSCRLQRETWRQHLPRSIACYPTMWAETAERRSFGRHAVFHRNTLRCIIAMRLRVTLRHEMIMKIIPRELFSVILEGFRTLKISGKERLLPETTLEIRNFVPEGTPRCHGLRNFFTYKNCRGKFHAIVIVVWQQK